MTSHVTYIYSKQRWILKKLFRIAASPKSIMVATDLAPNFDLEDFFRT